MEWYPAAKYFTNALSSTNPTPGGGAAAAMAGTMGCALAIMAAGTTLKRKTTSIQNRQLLENSLKNLQTFKLQLESLIQEDANAYGAYLAAKKMEANDETRSVAIEESLWAAAQVPADTATTAVHCLQEIDKMKEAVAPVIQSDVLCARHLLKSAIACAIENIKANKAYITNKGHLLALEKQLVLLNSQENYG